MPATIDTKQLARQTRLSEVNGVLRTLMGPEARRAHELYLRPDNRLRLRVEGTGGFDTDPAIRADGLWFANVNRRWFDVGGTTEQAMVQLVRWYRDLPRKSLPWWKSWASHGLGRPEMYEAISESSYNDPAKFACVLCGNPDACDWWSRDGVSGPACRGVFDGKCPVKGGV